ncbi:MAG: CpaF family protein, partial [Proteobacteria bacterium]|nr:CpaF family protein [Pseudomonadota bacterium]
MEINNHNKLSHEAYYALVAKLDPNIALLTPKKEFFAETFGFIQKHFNNQGIFLTEKDLTQISERVVSDIIGFGPLDHLIADERITEILVNDLNHVYIEIDGKLYRSDVTFQDQDHILRIAQRIAMKTGRRVDEKSPMVDARLPDGSRVNIITPPVCLNGPVISIRKFPKNLISLETMVSHGNLSLQIKEFLEMAIKARFNILISGGTGSGKTTLLNSLSQYIASDERVITIEDTAELRLNIPNLVRLEYRPANIEGEGEITIRDLVRNSLRMRPDRILVGEVRGVEAIDMLQAMNTGHDGSLSTIHANSASD